MSRKRDRAGLFFATTPHEALFIHVSCYAASMYVIDFICALSFGVQGFQNRDHFEIPACP
jgi:hypothetical protein